MGRVVSCAGRKREGKAKEAKKQGLRPGGHTLFAVGVSVSVVSMSVLGMVVWEKGREG
jgi:hypothetical protein